MPWFRSPVKLFACAALFLFLIRLVFPPADNAVQLHSYLHFFDFRLDLTGYCVFEFAALVFALCALTYYAVSRLTNGQPNGTLVHLHFWPSLLFAVSSVYLAHRVSRIPAGKSTTRRFKPLCTVGLQRSRGRSWLLYFSRLRSPSAQSGVSGKTETQLLNQSKTRKKLPFRSVCLVSAHDGLGKLLISSLVGKIPTLLRRDAKLFYGGQLRREICACARATRPSRIARRARVCAASLRAASR
jgi:hypothetical protein